MKTAESVMTSDEALIRRMSDRGLASLLDVLGGHLADCGLGASRVVVEAAAARLRKAQPGSPRGRAK
jgi:hypothetical protein